MIESISKPIRVLHIMESLGMGGGQIMMFELSNGLNRYFGDKCTSIVAGSKKDRRKVVVHASLTSSYGISPFTISYADIKAYCIKEKIDIVVHHRVSISLPVRSHIPKHIPYIVVSHTAASLASIIKFYPHADFVVSVCQNIWKCSPRKSKQLSDGKMPVILNGIENDFIKNIEPLSLKGGFKTGRCHRLVPTKFDLTSIAWMEKQATKIPSHVHYIIGAGNKGLPGATRGKKCSFYVGEIGDKIKKFSYIKAFDAYFYEIFSNEGASIAVLESLAAGVPVICLKRGGIKELVRHEKNGFIEKDRKNMLLRLKQLHDNPQKVKEMKEFTLKDFEERLHIKECARKYMKLFNRALEIRHARTKS